MQLSCCCCFFFFLQWLLFYLSLARRQFITCSLGILRMNLDMRMFVHHILFTPGIVEELASFFVVVFNSKHFLNARLFINPSLKHIGQQAALSYDPYGPARAFIAKLLRKSPYEGRTRWREQGRKKPSGPARIAYGPHTGIFSIVLQCKRSRDAN